MLIDFKKVPVPPSRAKELMPVLAGGWISVHAYMSTLPRNEKGLETVFYMAALEAQHARRKYVQYRIYRCYADKRREAEERLLYV